MTNNASLVLLTVRGTLVPSTLEAACALHNQTAGSAEGIAAARALGDLSHKVYAPVPSLGAQAGELMFLDFWKTAEGIGNFFGNPQVQGMAAKLFSARDAAVWMPARGAFGFDLPAPAAKGDRYLGVVRGAVASAEAAIEVFANVLAPKISDARRRGQLSHQLFVKLGMPGDASGLEIIGLDLWCDAAGMQEHYGELKGYDKAFSGAPQTSVWQAAGSGVWSEW